jgi:hypothetical protein
MPLQVQCLLDFEVKPVLVIRFYKPALDTVSLDRLFIC